MAAGIALFSARPPAQVPWLQGIPANPCQGEVARGAQAHTCAGEEQEQAPRACGAGLQHSAAHSPL